MATISKPTGAMGSTSTVSYTTNTTANQIYTTGSSGQFLTGAGSNGVSWTSPNVPAEALRITPGSPPELEVKGRLVLNGQDLEERLKTIEKVLTIPERDVTLETKHPRLKKLYDEYITALEEYRTWNRLTDD